MQKSSSVNHYFPLSLQNHFCRFLAIISLVLLAGTASQAAILSWSGASGTSGNWNDPANWGGVGIPANGDTLIFQGAQPRLNNTNNIAGLSLTQIRFNDPPGGGYNIWGNQFTINNSIMGTNSTGTNIIHNSIILATVDTTINVTAGLTLAGNLTGSVGLTKTGVGVLYYTMSGFNTYNGTTRVNTGSLLLQASGIDGAFTGPLIISDGSSTATVKLLFDRELPNNQPVTINNGGTFDLNNLNETIGSSLTLSGSTTIAVGTATLTMAAPNTISNLLGTCNITGSGNLQLGAGPTTIHVAGALTISPAIQGSGDITKTGNGTLVFSGPNTYSGLTTISQGWLWAENNTALGGTVNGTVVSNGATLVLYGGIAVTNESLTLNGFGEPAWSALDCEANETNIWAGPITLTADTDFGVYASGGRLRIVGGITGTGGVTEEASGIVTYEGTNVNSYSGTTTVNGGTLMLGKTGGVALAIPRGLVINSGNTVRNLAGNQMWAFGRPVTIHSGGLLDLAGFTDSVGRLTLDGGQITTGTGQVWLLEDVTVVSNTVAQSLINGNAYLYINSVTISNTGHYFSPDLRINAVVTSGGLYGFNKTGDGEVSLAAANTFTGPVTIDNGVLWMENSSSLGNTTTNITINSGGTLFMFGPLTVGPKPMTLNGGILLSDFGSSSWAGNITLASDSTINTRGAAYSLNLTGLIGGAAGFTKVGPGTLAMSGTGENTYTGSTIVNAGLLQLNQTSGHSINYGQLIVGDGLGGSDADVVRYINANGNQIFVTVPIRVNSSGLFDLNGHTDDIGLLTLQGGDFATGATGLAQIFDDINVLASSRTVNMSGKVQIYGGSNGPRMLVTDGSIFYTIIISANLSDSAAGGLLITNLNPTGNFTRLIASNSFTGPLTIAGGIVSAENPWALGTTANGTHVANGGQLFLFQTGITNESLTLDGGTTLTAQGNCTWSGPITLAGDATIKGFTGSGLFDLRGPIGGTGNLTFAGFGVTNRLSNPTADTYVGTTTVASGLLELNGTPFNGTIPGNLVIAGTVRSLRSYQVVNSADVLIQGGALWDFAAQTDEIDTLRGTGTAHFLDFGWIDVGLNNGTSTFDGLMTGTGYPSGYTLGKFGTGTFTMNGNNSYTDLTHIFNGALIVNGSQPQSGVIVESGATLGGGGTVGSILSAGNIAPGASPAILTSSNVDLTSSAGYYVDLTGPSPGSGYDQLNIRGTNTLGNATLHLNPAFTSGVGPGSQLVIINNDAADANVGTFNGLPEGSAITLGGYGFRISYVGGSGNDVVLTVTSVPLTQSGYAVTAGNGNHAIDPNECNSLSLIISNTLGAAVTGMSATLNSADPNVFVTQPYSTYPNMASGAKATNAIPFQISTLPSFVCGNDVNLSLTIASASHGTFNVPIVLKSGEPAVSPVRFDVSTTTNIPDVGTIESTNVVSGFVGSATKVVVSMWLTHTFDADLNVSLIAPDGTIVDLSSGNGSGPNFGTGCSPDASRTTFDDAAGSSITTGTPPFVGTFRPEGSLAATLGSPVNGNWRLRITDTTGGSLGALRCWSLFLYPTTCTPGGGACAFCPITITNTLTSSGAAQAGRLFRSGLATSCATPTVCPTLFDSTPRQYHAYPFYNGASNACISVTLTALNSCDVFTAAYMGTFDPANLCQNYLADCGFSAVGGSTSYSFNVPSNSVFLVTVNEVNSPLCGATYSIAVSGGDCTPILTPALVPPVQLDVNWPTIAGGYQLESSSILSPATWLQVTNEPIASANRFNVTNNISGPSRFYRLHKPF